MLTALDKVFFEFLEQFDIAQLSECRRDQILMVLPLLTRCGLCPPPDAPNHVCRASGQLLMKLLLDYNEVNFLVEALSAEFNEVSSDCLNQLKLSGWDQTSAVVLMTEENWFTESLRKKIEAGESIVHSDEIFANFESYSPKQKLKTVVTELKWLMASSEALDGSSNPLAKCAPSPILQLPLYRETVTHLICLALHELPSLLTITDVVEALLLVDESFDMIVKVIVNSPWSATEVCCALISRSKENNPNAVKQTRIEIIKYICRLSPTTSPLAAKTCISTNKLPQVLAWIYLNMDTQEATVSMIAEFIFTHRRLARSLLLSKDQNSADESELLTMIRRTLVNELNSLLTERVDQVHFIRLSSLIRLCACLRETINYKFSEIELEKMFKLFPNLPLTTEKDTHLMILALCLIITSIHQMASYSQQISAWLRSLAHNTRLYTQSSDTSIGQFLLLIAIHYHSNQLTTISEMVSSYLSIKSSTVKLSNTILKQIITYEVFTEPVISQLTVLLAVTKDLNGNMKGHLPIHCVCQLLKSRAFSKHNVSIAEWITSQLANVSLPLHPMIPQMISLYVASTMPQQHNVRSANPQLDERRIQEQFLANSDTSFASQLVFLYYVLCHQETVYSEPALSSKKRLIAPYSSILISSIPTKLLLTKAYECKAQCGSLYPSLVKLLYTNIPQMCKAEMWLPEACNHRRPNQLIKLFNDQFKDTSFVDSIHKQYIKLRLVSEKLSEDTLPVLMESIRLVQSSTVDSIPRHMTMVLTETWLAYSRIAPERLYPATVNILRDHHVMLTEEQLVTDPLLVLQCLPACRQPDLLAIILHLIGVYSRASNRFFNIHSQTRQTHGSSVLTDAQEICYSLLSAQESATLQIMLEHCLPTIQPGESILCNQREIQTLICSDVHKIIIDNPYQAKLVSFQGYDKRLIPIAISGIPSMHICLDYIPEMLAQPDIKKQVFAVRLTASLSQHYGVHKTFTMAKLCINTLNTLAGVLPTRSVITNILPVLPDVITICQNMPVLYEDWMKLLAKILPILAACRGEQDVSKQKSMALTLNVN